MELGLVASKQQASKQASKQARGPREPTGPFLDCGAVGVPRPKKNVTTLSGMLFRNFLGFNFFFGRTPPGRNRRFTGILATRALREILGPEMAPKYQKRAVVVRRGPKTGKKCDHAIRDTFPQLSRGQLFFRSDPPRPESAIYWYFGHPGTWRNSGAKNGPKMPKTGRGASMGRRGRFGCHC